MAKKRKSVATRLDEVDRTIYSTFCGAANSLSQLYTQAMNQQKVTFQAGERHAMEKVYNWILSQQAEGSRRTAADIVAYLQVIYIDVHLILICYCLMLKKKSLQGHKKNELDYGGEEASMSPRLHFQHQHSQPTMHLANSNFQSSTALFGQAQSGHGPRSGQADQNKNTVFSNALSSPIQRSLQPYQMAQAGGFDPNNVSQSGNGARNHEMNRESHSNGSVDTSMDMHSDSPGPESY